MCSGCAASSSLDRTLRLWEVKTGKEVRVLLTGRRQLQAAAFAPDGRHAVAAEDTGMLYVVEIRRDREHLGQVMSAIREWLDAQRFEPDAFRCDQDG